MSDDTDAPEPPRLEAVRLEPARPDHGESASSYMPRVPWKWVLGVTSFLALSIGTCQFRDRQETEALRLKVKDGYAASLAPIAKRYVTIAEHVRSHTLAALEKPAERYVDPRLKLDVLGSAPGVYLRVKAQPGETPAQSLAAAPSLAPDAIARCLGLAPASAGDLLAYGGFLEPAFIARADEADSVLKLRVIAEELRQRAERDLPVFADALKAQWFLLAIERGESRHKGPVDVYLWDVKENALLLSVRTEGTGALVSARIAVEGAKPGNYADGAQTGAAQDCAIANGVRALTGGAAPGFAADPPAPRAALNALAGDAGVSGAGAAADAGTSDASLSRTGAVAPPATR